MDNQLNEGQRYQKIYLFKARNVTCFSFHVLYPSSYDFKS